MNFAKLGNVTVNMDLVTWFSEWEETVDGPRGALGDVSAAVDPETGKEMTTGNIFITLHFGGGDLLKLDAAQSKAFLAHAWPKRSFGAKG